MKKKIALFLTAMAVCISVIACGQQNTDSSDNADSTNTEADNKVAGVVSQAEDALGEDYTLADIAEMNGLEEDQLNVLWGYNGGIVFLGDRYGDEIVTNPDQALASLDHVRTLAQLDGVELTYNRTDVSPVTGNIVYTFYQTTSTMLDGQEITVRFYNSLIKVITDADGNLVGLSADIVPSDEMETIDESEIITKEEAIEYVKSLIGDKRRMIYEKVSEYAFWDDEGTVFSVDRGSKVTPAWFIYADAAPDNKASKPYEVFVVSLRPQYSFDDNNDMVGSPAVIANYFVETLDFEDALDVYTSTFFFDGMKDAGQYTYEVKLDWVKKYYKDYKGPATAKYTVPVMYSETEDLYYLGDVNKKITLSNYYDFCMQDTTNAYVTKTPADKDSWHFQLDKAIDGSTPKYFDNPNYVLSSFSVMVDVWDDFYNRYGLDSVDGTGLPTMLCVYGLDEYEYPDKESDFMVNAVNLGQNRDWQVMATSITLPNCLEHVVMGHEYTHGINAQLTMSQYFNGPGAVMESYADIIGAQMGMVSKHPESLGEHEWHIGGAYGMYMRNMSDPYEFKMPQFIGGNYYLNPVYEAISGTYDEGGVHTNSSILNFLTYCLVNGTGEENEATLTMDECLDMWFDTLYYTNHQTDYYDVATYLTLAAESMGLEEAKYYYLRQLLVDFGLIPDADGESYVSYTEDSDYYNIRLTYDDSVYNNLDEVFKLGVTFYDEGDEYYGVGGLAENDVMSYGIEPDVKLTSGDVVIGNMLSGDSETLVLDEADALPHDMDLYFTLVEVEAGEIITVDSGYELTYAIGPEDMQVDIDVDEENCVYFEPYNEGTLVATLKDVSASDKDYGKYMICMIICE